MLFQGIASQSVTVLPKYIPNSSFQCYGNNCIYCSGFAFLWRKKIVKRMRKEWYSIIKADAIMWQGEQVTSTIMVEDCNFQTLTICIRGGGLKLSKCLAEFHGRKTFSIKNLLYSMPLRGTECRTSIQTCAVASTSDLVPIPEQSPYVHEQLTLLNTYHPKCWGVWGKATYKDHFIYWQ